jgi:D-sedoheptulose 7-phosphate isomerase
MSATVKGTSPGRFPKNGTGGLGLLEFARWYREREIAQWAKLDLRAIDRLTQLLLTAERRGRHVFVMGNGGSAATAASIAVDFGKTAALPGRRALKCISLAESSAFITAMSNDHDFDEIFVKQLENLLMPGDVALFVSGSGNSPNLIKAARFASAHGAGTAALLGFDGGRLKALVDVSVLIPSSDYGVIEDMHLAVSHVITFFLRQRRR